MSPRTRLVVEATVLGTLERIGTTLAVREAVINSPAGICVTRNRPSIVVVMVVEDVTVETNVAPSPPAVSESPAMKEEVVSQVIWSVNIPASPAVSESL